MLGHQEKQLEGLRAGGTHPISLPPESTEKHVGGGSGIEAFSGREMPQEEPKEQGMSPDKAAETTGLTERISEYAILVDAAPADVKKEKGVSSGQEMSQGEPQKPRRTGAGARTILIFLETRSSWIVPNSWPGAVFAMIACCVVM